MATINYGRLLIVFLTLFVLIWSKEAESAKKFQCYHGESNDGNNETSLYQMDCPSGVCIMYVTPSQNYWATTCYDDSNPTGITKSFNMIVKLKQTSYSICRYSGCNKDPIKILLKSYPYSPYEENELYYETFKPPKSFDNLLWPSLGKEKRNKKDFLENSLKLREKYIKVKDSNKVYYPSFGYDVYEFLGQTYNSSTKVWIEIKFLDKKDSKIEKKLRISFDLLESTLTGCLSSDTTKAKIYGKFDLKEKLFPGQIINVTLIKKSTMFDMFQPNFTLWVNDELLNYTVNDMFYSIKYGGIMSSVPGDQTQDYDLSIIFTEPEPTKPPQKFHCDENFMAVFKPQNSKLHYTFTVPELKNGSTVFLLKNNTLKPNEMIEFELRESLCPQSSAIRIQIQAFEKIEKNETIIFYHFYVWIYASYEWLFINQKIIKFQECSNLFIKPLKNIDEITCQNDNYSSSKGSAEKKFLSVPSVISTYLVKSPIEKFKS